MVYLQTVSSHSQKFFKIGVLKNFVKLTGKYLCRSLSLITQRGVLFSKRDSDTAALLWILWIFWKTTFLQNNFGRLFLSSWNVFAISINFILFSQYGFSRNKCLEAVVDVFQKRCSKKFHKFHQKSLCWSLFLFDKFAVLKRPATLLKKDYNTGVLLWNLGNF